MNKINARKALNPAYRKHKPVRKDVNSFVEHLKECIDVVKLSDDNNESEEHIKEPIKKFLQNTFYQNNLINTKDRIDLAIFSGENVKSDVSVIIEAKRPSNKGEFLTVDSLNRKALQELLLYYLRERIDNENNSIKHLIATNGYEWFLFKSDDFYKFFYKNKALIKEYTEFKNGQKDSSKNELFYNEIASKYIAKIENELPFVHLNFFNSNFEKFSDANLNTVYKIFSNVHILGDSFGNDSNQLNRAFYNELLHIIGLEEIKDKGKKVIIRRPEKNREYGSLLENTIFTLEDRDHLQNVKSITGENKAFEVGLELCLSWINRILFLKLLESQLLTYHKGAKEYNFLNTDFLQGFDELNNLFFSALAKKIDDRHPKIKDKFKHIPYLNSSLFERNEMESETFEISGLNDDEIEVYSNTVLKDPKGKKFNGKLNTLDYLFKFLDAFDFATDGTEGISDETESKSLINASVLGLIFEKINGYKEGSFYTPAFVTMYMCKETLRKAVVSKFKEQENKDIENFEDLKAYCNRYFKQDDTLRFNTVVNSLKICDPAVGSGHFLVSALNELIAIKSELGILVDAKGVPLRCDLHIENDELYITDAQGLLFEYNPKDVESVRVQHTLFSEKRSIIESCLFGVDINPNSVKICRLRLWIELLKNAYYTKEGQLQTLPNIDINIKCGNSLISRFDLDDDLKDAFKGKDVKHSFKDYKEAVEKYKNTNDKEVKRNVLSIIDGVKNNFTSTLDDEIKLKNQVAQGEYDNEKIRLDNLKQFGEKIRKADNDNLKKLKIKAEKATQKKEEISNNVIYHDAFEWRFEFPEVLDEQGGYIGFDAIIGNPPYFQLQFTDYGSMDYLKQFEVYEKTGDIYSLFFERAFSTLRENGILSFITSNRFCSTNYGESTRRYLSRYGINTIVNVNDVDIFEEANVGTFIGIIEKNNDRGLLKAFEIKTIEEARNIQNVSDNTVRDIHSEFFGEKSWIFASNEVLKLKNKLEQIGTPLSSLNDIKINRGITTSANPIFIIDKDRGEEFIRQNPKNKDIIKPVLKGAEIKRYFVKDYSNYIILTKTGIDMSDYKEVFDYLLENKEALEKVYEARKGMKQWYELRNCAYYDSFAKEKLIWTRLANVNSFAISKDGEYSIDSTSFAVGENLKYYLAILNSKVVFFYFKLGSVIWGKDGIKWFGDFFNNIPVPNASEDEMNKIIAMSDQILRVKIDKNGSSTLSLENDLDQFIYNVYGLNEDEIRIVEQR